MTNEDILATKRRLLEIKAELRAIGERWRGYIPEDAFQCRYAGAAWKLTEAAADLCFQASVYAPEPDLPSDEATT